MANILVVTLNSSNFNFLIGRQELEAQIITIKQKKQQQQLFYILKGITLNVRTQKC